MPEVFFNFTVRPINDQLKQWIAARQCALTRRKVNSKSTHKPYIIIPRNYKGVHYAEMTPDLNYIVYVQPIDITASPPSIPPPCERGLGHGD